MIDATVTEIGASRCKRPEAFIQRQTLDPQIWRPYTTLGPERHKMLRSSTRKPYFEIWTNLAISYEASAKNTKNIHESGTAARFGSLMTQRTVSKKRETFFEFSFPRRQLHVWGCALSKASRFEFPPFLWSPIIQGPCPPGPFHPRIPSPFHTRCKNPVKMHVKCCFVFLFGSLVALAWPKTM